MLSDNPWTSLLGMLISVAVITGLAYWFTRYVLGRSQNFQTLGQGKEQHLRLINCLALGKSEKIAVVQAGSRYLLLGITEQNITVLTELTEEEGKSMEQPGKYAELPGFRQSLTELLQKKNRGEKK